MGRKVFWNNRFSAVYYNSEEGINLAAAKIKSRQFLGY